MATDETIRVHPGDVVQDSDGLFLLVTQCHGWGIEAVMRWRQGPPPYEIAEHGYRLKPGQFVVVGTAHTLPVEVRQARQDSLRTEREVERDRQREQGT